MIIVLNLGKFEHASAKFLHYYVLIRDSDGVPAVFPRMETWLSAQSITVYYDGPNASVFDANLIVDLLKGPIRKFDFIPIQQSLLTNLDENIMAALDAFGMGDDVFTTVDEDSASKDFCVYIEKMSRKRARFTVT